MIINVNAVSTGPAVSAATLPFLGVSMLPPIAVPILTTNGIDLQGILPSSPPPPPIQCLPPFVNSKRHTIWRRRLRNTSTMNMKAKQPNRPLAYSSSHNSAFVSHPYCRSHHLQSLTRGTSRTTMSIARMRSSATKLFMVSSLQNDKGNGDDGEEKEKAELQSTEEDEEDYEYDDMAMFDVDEDGEFQRQLYSEHGDDDMIDDEDATALFELLGSLTDDEDDDSSMDGDDIEIYTEEEFAELERLLGEQGWEISSREGDDWPISSTVTTFERGLTTSRSDSFFVSPASSETVPTETRRTTGAETETATIKSITKSSSSSSQLEKALLQGVVPAGAGVGSKCLPGDYGFDPLNLATKDYFKIVQNFLLGLLPSPVIDEEDATDSSDTSTSTKSATTAITKRPAALILRDYREAEIRHGRLAMLASLLWPLQEIIDRIFIPERFGQTTMIYGGVTLPYLSLLMTLIMLLLGYLDIYAASIKDVDTGDAFLPGECFWDPLRILDGAPENMKRNMQQRELNNGRFAMVAVFCYILQEAVFHQPLITLPWNVVLFEPAFEIPAVQAWLDGQFSGNGGSSALLIPDVGVPVDFVKVLEEVTLEESDSTSGSIAGTGLVEDIVENVAGNAANVAKSVTGN